MPLTKKKARSGPMARRWRAPLSMVSAVLLGLTMLPAASGADELPTTDDPRYGLGVDEVASHGINHLAQVTKVDTGLTGFNSDMAFTGDYVLQGNYHGFNVVDASDPANPTVRTSVLCPGGQGDLNVYGHLVFQSVEENSGRVDCGTQSNPGGAQPDRFRGVRIWDISDLDNPVQVAGIQTCRGSHTNRLVEDPNDPHHVYIYNNGTAGQRSPGEKVHTPDGFVDGRCGRGVTDPNPSSHMIEIIKVPVADPASAEVVKEWRLFADEETGAVNGLQNGPTRAGHPCSTTPRPDGSGLNSCAPAGTNYSPSPNTNTCHDITVYPEVGLAAGACQGNGILIDISDPADPVRLDVVADENFAYWHSANFSNDGETVMFTDEWGGGSGPRCAPHHRTSWGANAFFTIDRSGGTPQLEFQSYYKLPVAQSTTENCVAHQANILPVPGRDVMIQAWYQGGASLLDFTDPAHPVEIGYFDRGPISATQSVLGGFWSSYWYNGNVFGSEIHRGLDIMELTPTAQLSAHEIAAAKTVQLDEHNAMSMRMYEWEPSIVLARAYLDQVVRAGEIPDNKAANITRSLDRAENPKNPNQRRAQLQAALNQTDAGNPAHASLRQALQDLM
ncbi:LVIVD repeat-containing protein [Ornithinimicrobium sufpigmenti]|uniref:LVIVD repeat-containing protein n=1 Tax=Ornithinimicrobium sufpigmenti TaxID=2508882 RepID=UPI0015E19479|nr:MULTISPECIES: hypothetical protein [unclassified Ornithinimicrobium]